MTRILQSTTRSAIKKGMDKFPTEEDKHVKWFLGCPVISESSSGARVSPYDRISRFIQTSKKFKSFNTIYVTFIKSVNNCEVKLESVFKETPSYTLAEPDQYKMEDSFTVAIGYFHALRRFCLRNNILVNISGNKSTVRR